MDSCLLLFKVLFKDLLLEDFFVSKTCILGITAFHTPTSQFMELFPGESDLATALFVILTLTWRAAGFDWCFLLLLVFDERYIVKDIEKTVSSIVTEWLSVCGCIHIGIDHATQFGCQCVFSIHGLPVLLSVGDKLLEACLLSVEVTLGYESCRRQSLWFLLC